MAEQKRESSVLFSLRELRQIEDDRVKTEESVARQKVEDERARVLAEERRVRDEAERVRREAEEAARLKEEAEENRNREEQLRLEETERKHRVEAQMRLEEQRLKLEIEAKARANSTRKAKVLVSATGAMVLLVGALFAYAWKANADREETKRMTSAAIAAKEKAFNELLQKANDEAKQIAMLQDQTAKDVDELKRTQDADQQRLIRERIERRQREMAAAADRERAARDAAEARRRAPVKITNCKNPNDPLCGL